MLLPKIPARTGAQARSCDYKVPWQLNALNSVRNKTIKQKSGLCQEAFNKTSVSMWYFYDLQSIKATLSPT